jgi:C4-dicarboxylate-specific signal transduction histidine kinase
MTPRPDIEIETLAAFGQLVASVAHKLNNDLTAVRGYSDLLDEELRELSNEDERLRDVAEQAETLKSELLGASKAIQSLAAFALGRRPAGVHPPTAAFDEVVAVLGASLGRAGIAIERDVHPEIPRMDQAKTAAFQRMMLLLLLLAQKALEERASERRLYLGLHPYEGGIRFTVRHNGTAAFDERAMNRLDACAAIAQQAGGTLVSETSAEGRTHVLELPV